jgi:hypothetical protein
MLLFDANRSLRTCAVTIIYHTLCSVVLLFALEVTKSAVKYFFPQPPAICNPLRTCRNLVQTMDPIIGPCHGTNCVKCLRQTHGEHGNNYDVFEVILECRCRRARKSDIATISKSGTMTLDLQSVEMPVKQEYHNLLLCIRTGAPSPQNRDLVHNKESVHPRNLPASID